MKTKHMKKIGIVAIVMLVFTALTLLIRQLGEPVKTRAEYGEE